MTRLGKGGPPDQIPETANYIDISRKDIENADKQEIGTGASSIVYRAELKDKFRTNIAVKYPDFSGTVGQPQFEAIIEEAKVWTGLTNSDDGHSPAEGLSGQDHIVDVIDWGQGADALPWIALEYMDDGSLQELLDNRSNPLPVDKALWISLCLCRGVRHAHRYGVRHHDIKPSNILLRKTAAGWNLPKITDWGVAKVMIEENQQNKGFTPAYAAPEQFHPEDYRTPDETTDIYQIGILTYRLLTGELPFDGAAPEIKKAKLAGDFVPVSEQRDLPPEFDQLINKAISTSPSSRFEAVVYLRDEIQALFEEHREKVAQENTLDGLQLDATEDLIDQETPETPETSTDAQTDDKETALAETIDDWEAYREDLDEREARPLYSISPQFIRNLLYPDLTAEVERAHEERQRVEDVFTTIRSEARDVRAFLEDQMYDAAILNDSLEDEVNDRLNAFRDITDECDHLLSEKKRYLKNTEQQRLDKLRGDLADHYRYLTEKKKLNKALETLRDRLDQVSEEITDTIPDDELLTEAEEQRLLDELDKVSSGIRHTKVELSMEILKDTDTQAFEKLLADERKLRREVEEHNQKLVQQIYSDLNDVVIENIETTNEALDKYHRRDISLETAQTHIDSLEAGVINIDSFLDSRKSEYITPDQQDTFEQRKSKIQSNLEVFRAKVEFEEYHDQIQAEISTLQSSIDELLDMETYLSDNEQSELQTQIEVAHDVVLAVYQDDLVKYLNDKNIERFHTAKIEIARSDRQVREYNPKLVQQNYPEIKQQAAEAKEETDNAIETYHDPEQTINRTSSAYVETLTEQTNQITDVLNTWKVDHLTQNQKQTLEELVEEIRSNLSLFANKEEFEERIDAVNEYTSELETATDELLDMNSYLSEDDRTELDELVTNIQDELNHIADNNLADQLNSEDTDRLSTVRVELGSLDRRIQEYNERLVNKRFSEKGSDAESVIADAEDGLEACKQRGKRLPADVETLEEDLDTVAITLSEFRKIEYFSLLSTSQRDRVSQLLQTVESYVEYIDTKYVYDDYMETIEDKFDKLQSLYDDHLDFESYLIVEKMEAIHNQIDTVSDAVTKLEEHKVLKTLSVGDRRRVRGYAFTLDRYLAHVNTYNQEFIQHESDEYGELFENLSDDDISLNQQQQEAVFTNERHNRIIAGPGTGKTFSLVCRIRYLIAKGVAEEDILALAFNTKAEGEISGRLKNLFGVEQVDVQSLNSFGYDIIDSSHPDWFVLVNESRLREIERIIQQMCDRNDDFQGRYLKLHEKYKIEEYEEKQDVEENIFEQIKYSGDTTFASESIENKSTTEQKALRDIADTLFKHGIDYEYSRYADWTEQSIEDDYTPDFTLPKYKMCIEYIPPESVQREKQRWKKKRTGNALKRIYADTEYDLITIYGDDISRDTISKILRAKLAKNGIETENPLPESKLKTAVFNRAVERELIEKIGNFIEHTKTNQIDPGEKLAAMDAEEGSLLHRFTSIATLVYNKYESLYEEYGAFDYKDMEVMAKDMLEAGEDDLSINYDHVLVDEFQDLNLAQIQLVQQILDRSDDARLFAVGDDWQSIYGFKGARPEYFVNFEEHFSPAATTRLNTNYRCPASIIDSSNELMEGLDVSTDKSLEAANFAADTKPTVHTVPGRDGYQYKKNVVSDILDIITESVESHGRLPDDIMLLARKTLGSPYIPRITERLDERDIPVGDRNGVTIDTAHSSKGTEAEHVIVLNASRGHADGFPPEEPKSNLLEAVDATDDSHIAEERRLFYVAITRTKRDLDVQTRYGHKSQFLPPIEKHGKVDSIGFDADQSRVSITGQVESPNNNHVGKQIGSLQMNGYRISYKITNDCSETDGFEENQRYELENVKVGSYDGAPQFVIDQDTEITEVS